jgi:hypothetical protein
MEPCKGAVAICGLGRLGLIESDEPQEVTYGDGTASKAWIGKHIWPLEFFGLPWSSRNPRVLMTCADVSGGELPSVPAATE